MASQSSANEDMRVVVGLGATGLSCARFLRARGLPFAVIDTRSEPPGAEALRSEMSDVPLYTGDYPAQLITGAGEVVVSPGIGLDAPIVAQALAEGVPVVGDVDLFMREAGAPVVGITGSNAKSTVTELLGQMARDAAVSVGVGGNLGTPALELLDDSRNLYILELSSFQLERSDSLGLEVATVLNVSEDHLDRHGDMEDYQKAKHRIFRGCHKAVIHPDDPATVPLLSAEVEVCSWRLAEPEGEGFGLLFKDSVEYLARGQRLLLPVGDMHLVGRHNVANALAALALGHCAGLPLEVMVTTLRTFKGLPHRCERVADIEGVRYVNDSKGTNVGATQAALEGLGGDRDIVLIAGGQGKGADFSVLEASVARHCKVVLLIGEDAPLLDEALGGAAPVARTGSLEEAVQLAAGLAVAGDTVLLSPACASFDMFDSYLGRGEAFCAAVTALQGGAS